MGLKLKGLLNTHNVPLTEIKRTILSGLKLTLDVKVINIEIVNKLFIQIQKSYQLRFLLSDSFSSNK